MALKAAYMVPHPPLIVPDIGRGSEEQIRQTIDAYEQVAKEIVEAAPETIIITSPHSIMYADYFHISPGESAGGSFSEFGAPRVSFHVEYDTELVREICRIADERDFPAGTEGEREPRLDHGTMVPLWFIERAWDEACKGNAGSATDTGSSTGTGQSAPDQYRIVRIGLSGLPLADHYRMGQIVSEAIEATGRDAVIVASGDLSHKLQEDGPYGFAEEGPEYDERIMDICGRAAFGDLFDFDEGFCSRAAECGHRSFVIMAGAFDGKNVDAKALSHQDVTGVGYGICTFHPAEKGNGEQEDTADRHFLNAYLRKTEEKLAEARKAEDPYVRLARQSLESYVLKGEHIDIPDGLPEEMKSIRAGAFVSIHKDGALRGCIGTTGPTTDCVAQEIIDNAISASTRDPRFPPIGPGELDRLEISVDVLGEAEDIDSPDELDVKRYGVIVSSVGKRGLLLPDLDGIDTVEQQIDIARQKAGIHRFESIRLQRFEVVRHE